MNNLSNDIAYLKSLTVGKDYHCGWMNDETLGLLTGLIKFYKPEIVIHTGFLWGKSSAFVLNALAELPIEESPETSTDQTFYNFTLSNAPKRSLYRVIAIDNNMFNLEVDDAASYLADSYGDFILCMGSSHDFFESNKEELKNLPRTGSIFGIVDGDHTAEGCMKDLVDMDYVGANVLIVDDTMWLPYLDTVCRDFAEKYNYSYMNHRLHSGLGVLVKNV